MIEIAEFKGHQQLHARLASEFLRAFRIEGITVAQGRLRPLLADLVKPTDQSEREIRGFYRALEMIYATTANVQITPAYLCELHETILGRSPESGQWRAEDLGRVELRCGESPRIAVESVPAAEIPSSVEELCMLYRESLTDEFVHPLLAVAALVLDFLCLHPFPSGQVRLAYLVALLGLCQNGFTVGRYVSLAGWLERSLEPCSAALRFSSQGWREGKHDLNPWLEYFFSVLRSAYSEFEQCVDKSKSVRGAKGVLVETAIEGFLGNFGYVELEQACPGVSRRVIDRMLQHLLKKGLIERTGRGSYIARQSATDS